MAANPPLPTPRPDYTPQSNLAGVNRVGGLRTGRGKQRTIKGVVVHHTGPGIKTVKQTIDVLNGRGLGAHVVIDRNGVAHVIAEPGTKVGHVSSKAKHQTSLMKALGLSNANAIGIEVIGANDDDITPQQVAGTLGFLDQLTAEYPGIGNNVVTHRELNTHKQKTEGWTIAGAYRQRQDERLAADERFGLGVTPNTGAGPWGMAENAPGYAALMAETYGGLGRSLKEAGVRGIGGGVVAPSPPAAPPRGRPVSPVASNFARPALAPSGLPARSVPVPTPRPERTIPTTARLTTPATVAGASRMTPSTGLTAQQSLTRAATLSPSSFQTARLTAPATIAGASRMAPRTGLTAQQELTRAATLSPRQSAPAVASRFQDVTTAVPTARPATPAQAAVQTAAASRGTFNPVTVKPTPGKTVATPAKPGVPTYGQTMEEAAATIAANASTPAKTAASLTRAPAMPGGLTTKVAAAPVTSAPVTSIEEAPTAPRQQQAKTQTGAFPAAPGLFPEAPAAYDPAHPPGVLGKVGDLLQRYGPSLALKAAGVTNPVLGIGAHLLGMSLNNAKPGQLLGNPFAGLGKMFQSAPQTYQGPRTTYGTGLHAISDVLGGGTPVGGTAYSRSTPGYRVTNVGNNTIEKVNQYGYRSYEQVKPGLTASKTASKKTSNKSDRAYSPGASRAIGAGKGGLY